MKWPPVSRCGRVLGRGRPGRAPHALAVMVHSDPGLWRGVRRHAALRGAVDEDHGDVGERAGGAGVEVRGQGDPVELPAAEVSVRAGHVA